MFVLHRSGFTLFVLIVLMLSFSRVEANTLQINQFVCENDLMQPLDFEGAGAVIAWEFSTDDLNFQTIAGASGRVLDSEVIGPITSDLYFRVLYEDQGDLIYSNVVSIILMVRPTFGNLPNEVLLVDYGGGFEQGLYSNIIDGSLNGFSILSKPDWVESSFSSDNLNKLFGDFQEYDNTAISGVAYAGDQGYFAISSDGTSLYNILENGQTSLIRSDLNPGVTYSLRLFEGYLYIPRFNEDINSLTRIPLDNLLAEEELVLSSPGGFLYLNSFEGELFTSSVALRSVFKIDFSNDNPTLVSIVNSSNGLPSNSPFGFDFDTDGNIYIATGGTSSIFKFDGANLTRVFIGPRRSYVTSVQLDLEGNFYVSFSGLGVRKYNADFTQFTTVSLEETKVVYNIEFNETGALVYVRQNTDLIYNLRSGLVFSGTSSKADLGLHEIEVQVSNENCSSVASFFVEVVDRIPPLLESTSPIHMASDVDLLPLLSFTFDEEIKLGNSGLFRLYDEDGNLLQSFDLSNPEHLRHFSISEDQLTLSLQVPEPLPHLSKIVVNVEPQSVFDLSDNSYAGISFDSKSYFFTTKDKLPQSFNFDPIPEKIYGDSEFVLGDEFTDQGKPVVYVADDPSIVSIDGNRAEILQAGTTTIFASQSGDAFVYPATSKSQDLVVNKAELVFSVSPDSKTYDGFPFSSFSYAVSGWAYEEDESVLAGEVVYSGPALTGFSVGEYSLSLGFQDLSSSNYSFIGNSAAFEIYPAELLIVADSGQEKIYGEVDPVFTYTVSGWADGEDDSLLSGSLSRQSGEEVGNYALNLGSISAGDNYTLRFVGSDFSVKKRLLAVYALEGQGKVYGESDNPLEYDVSGFVAGEGEELLSGALVREPGETAGMYWINLGSLTAGSNYEIDYTGANFEISKKLLELEVDTGQIKSYGEEDPVLSYTVRGFVENEGEELINGFLDRIAGEEVGFYPIGIGSLNAGPNYAIDILGTDFEIKPRELTIRALSGQWKIYGSLDPDLVFTAEGLQFGEIAKDVLEGHLERLPGEAVGKYRINQGSLRPNSNYTISYVSNDFEIKERELVIVADSGQEKIYGEVDPFFTYTVLGWADGEDDSLLSGSLSRPSGEEVGNYALNLGSISAGDNYTIRFVGSDFSVKKRLLSVSALEGQGKVYGESDDPLEYDVSGFVAGEGEELLSGALVRESGENAGMYWINLGSLTAGSNYAIDYRGANFEIKRRAIRVTADAGQFKIYGDPDVVLTYSVDGILEVDSDIEPKGTLGRNLGEQVGLYDLNLGTLDYGPNYEIDFVPNLFEIRQRQILVIASAGQGKIYGEADPILSYAVSGLAEGDTKAIFTGNLARVGGEQVGKYKILQGSLSAGDNYIFDFISDDFGISPKEIWVHALPDQYKFFGDEDPQFEFEVKGLEFADDESVFTGQLLRDKGEEVGEYALLQGTLAAGGNYDIRFESEDFFILKKKVKVSLSESQYKIYGDPDPEFSLGLEGDLKEEFKVLFQSWLVREEGEHVGYYDFYLRESDLSHNFEIEFARDSFEIRKRDLFLIPDPNQFKFYRDEDPLFQFRLENLADLDSETIITGSLSRASGESLGTYPFTKGSIAATQNYNLILEDEIFEIKSIDRDGDGVPDHIEEEQGTDPLDSADFLDSDGDGVPDYVELLQETNPFNPGDYLDSDGDGVPDWIEKIDGTDPNDPIDFMDKNGNGIPDYVDLRSVIHVFEEEIVIPWGSAWEDLAIPDAVRVVTSSGDTLSLPVNWDEIMLDFFKSGMYPNKGELILSPGLFNPKELMALLNIIVLPKPSPEDLTLNNNVFTADQSKPYIFVGYFTVIDPVDDVHFLSLVDGYGDNALFTIYGNELFWSSSEPYPGRKTFSIKVLVLDRDGNSFEKEFIIYRKIPAFSEIVVFNTFTPNQDGKNETWGVPSLVFFENVQLSIFDRGGILLFHSKRADGRWDGTYKGKPMPIGSYYWVIQVGDTNETRRGFLNLLRD